MVGDEVNHLKSDAIQKHEDSGCGRDGSGPRDGSGDRDGSEVLESLVGRADCKCEGSNEGSLCGGLQAMKLLGFQ